MRLLQIFVVGLSCLCVATAFRSYDGYKVFRTSALAASDKEHIADLWKRSEFEFWNVPRVGRQVDIMASPEHAPELQAALHAMRLNPVLVNANVGESFARQKREIEHMRAKEKALGKAPSFDRYLNFDEILAYVDEVVSTYPEIASTIDIGSSIEGRPLRVLKLSNGAGKKGIFFDSAIHAREWIGPPTALYAINELTENLANNQALLDANDWYFLLVANPDGYVFSWTDDRMWRKNRNENNGNACKGVDLNRNFDFSWSGASASECDLTFAGAGPNSEPEVKAITDFLLANTDITGYCAIHSYGQVLLHPYGDRPENPPNAEFLGAVGTSAIDALYSVAQTSYTIGSTYNELYEALGISVDWAYDVAGIPLSFTIELRGDEGGFDIPPSYIVPSNAETWEAYKVIAANLPQSRGIIN